jgi:hypothetical protein
MVQQSNTWSFLHTQTPSTKRARLWGKPHVRPSLVVASRRSFISDEGKNNEEHKGGSPKTNGTSPRPDMDSIFIFVRTDPRFFQSFVQSITLMVHNTRVGLTLIFSRKERTPKQQAGLVELGRDWVKFAILLAACCTPLNVTGTTLFVAYVGAMLLYPSVLPSVFRAPTQRDVAIFLKDTLEEFDQNKTGLVDVFVAYVCVIVWTYNEASQH